MGLRMGFGDVATLVYGLVNEVDGLLDIYQQQSSLRIDIF